MFIGPADRKRHLLDFHGFPPDHDFRAMYKPGRALQDPTPTKSRKGGTDAQQTSGGTDAQRTSPPNQTREDDLSMEWPGSDEDRSISPNGASGLAPNAAEDMPRRVPLPEPGPAGGGSGRPDREERSAELAECQAGGTVQGEAMAVDGLEAQVANLQVFGNGGEDAPGGRRGRRGDRGRGRPGRGRARLVL
jgi:hypothetical protein